MKILEQFNKIWFILKKNKNEEQKIEGRWEVRDRMFSEEHMYNFVNYTADAKNLWQTKKALPFMSKCHAGQTRKGKEKIPYIYHPLMMACHALAMKLDEDDIIATILLHDVCEDCGISPEELPVGNEVKKAVNLLTFQRKENETKEDAKKRYFQQIEENRLATIVKVLDRCNNISTMATGFTKARMADYIEETEQYILPLLTKMKIEYPECYNPAFLLKYQMLSILESMKRII